MLRWCQAAPPPSPICWKCSAILLVHAQLNKFCHVRSFFLLPADLYCVLIGAPSIHTVFLLVLLPHNYTVFLLVNGHPSYWYVLCSHWSSFQLLYLYYVPIGLTSCWYTVFLLDLLPGGIYICTVFLLVLLSVDIFLPCSYWSSFLLIYFVFLLVLLPAECWYTEFLLVLLPSIHTVFLLVLLSADIYYIYCVPIGPPTHFLL